MATSSMSTAHALIGQSHVDQGLLVLIAPEVVHLLALQLVLNPFAVGSIADKRKNRPDAFD